ncbi:type II secretion system protein GspJ [Planctomycetota bacterium]
MKRHGFTFVEVTAAVAIGAFVTLVAVGALKSVSDGTQTVRMHSEMAAEMRFVAGLMQRDLENLYHDSQLQNMKLIGGVEMTEDDKESLTFYTLLYQKARATMPESDVYEVEYGLMEGDDRTLFYRRVWPNPDKEREPGGVVTALSERIVDFRVRFFDGEEWTDQWSEEENRALPDLIEVQVVGQWDEDRRPVMRNILVNFAQGEGEIDVEEGSSGDGEAGGNDEQSKSDR